MPRKLDQLVSNLELNHQYSSLVISNSDQLHDGHMFEQDRNSLTLMPYKVIEQCINY